MYNTNLTQKPSQKPKVLFWDKYELAGIYDPNAPEGSRSIKVERNLPPDLPPSQYLTGYIQYGEDLIKIGSFSTDDGLYQNNLAFASIISQAYAQLFGA